MLPGPMMEQVPIQLGQIAGQILDWIGQQFGATGIDPLGALAVGGICAFVYWACTGEGV